jgi:hypothetical protein
VLIRGGFWTALVARELRVLLTRTDAQLQFPAGATVQQEANQRQRRRLPINSRLASVVSHKENSLVQMSRRR